MSKTNNVTFELKLKFADKRIDEKDIAEIARKVMNALVSEVNQGNGLAPDESDTFTSSIEVCTDEINSIATLFYKPLSK